jgi:hypothetical protein
MPALLRHWWPMMSFIVFKSPAEGRTHIFKPGEPFMQIIIIPAEANFDLIEMGEEEAAERELQSRRIHESRATLGADSQWISSTNTVFDGTTAMSWAPQKDAQERGQNRASAASS